MCWKHVGTKTSTSIVRYLLLIKTAPFPFFPNKKRNTMATEDSYSVPADDMSIPLAILKTMQRQEETTYRVRDYIDDQLYAADASFTAAAAAAAANSNHDSDAVLQWRFEIVDWCYHVVDMCSMHRETVCIALSYLDRYLSTDAGKKTRLNKGMFELTAMTCLYIAIKLHEPATVGIETMLLLGCSGRVYAYTVSHVQFMERVILHALEWRMHPPTAVAFLRQFLELIPTSVLSRTLRAAVFDLARFQVELAVCDQIFVTAMPSTIAVSSFMNAAESIDKVGLGKRCRIHLSAMLSIDCDGFEIIHQTQRYLFELATRPRAMLGRHRQWLSYDSWVESGKEPSHVRDGVVKGGNQRSGTPPLTLEPAISAIHLAHQWSLASKEGVQAATP